MLQFGIRALCFVDLHCVVLCSWFLDIVVICFSIMVSFGSAPPENNQRDGVPNLKPFVSTNPRCNLPSRYHGCGKAYIWSWKRKKRSKSPSFPTCTSSSSFVHSSRPSKVGWRHPRQGKEWRDERKKKNEKNDKDEEREEFEKKRRRGRMFFCTTSVRACNPQLSMVEWNSSLRLVYHF